MKVKSHIGNEYSISDQFALDHLGLSADRAPTQPEALVRLRVGLSCHSAESAFQHTLLPGSDFCYNPPDSQADGCESPGVWEAPVAATVSAAD